MNETNSSTLRGYYQEVVNQKRIDLIPKYVSEEFHGHEPAYVGIGMMMDDSNGTNVTVRAVASGGPADGRLMVGDEIVRVFDGERTRQTYEELRQPIWGRGVVGTPLTVWVRRDGEEREIILTRGVVPSFEMPYRFLEPFERENFEEWPDLQARLLHVVEDGDLVAFYAEARGRNARYGRSAVWAESGIVRFREGKIVDWWIVGNDASLMKQLGYAINEPELEQK